MLQDLRYLRKCAITFFKNRRLLSLPMCCLVEKHWLGYQRIQIMVPDVLCVLSQPASNSLSVKQNNVYTLICVSGINVNKHYVYKVPSVSSGVFL